MFKNLINILAAPKETFISIKEKPTVLFPLLLSVLALISVQWGYFNIVDRDFLIEELIVQAQAFVDVPEDQLRANKAIGAKRHQILLQFLFESLLLCLLGGFIGLLLGFGIGVGIAAAIGIPQAYVPLWAVLLAFGFSAFVGIVFGIMPAAKAANLDPIEALRYE